MSVDELAALVGGMGGKYEQYATEIRTNGLNGMTVVAIAAQLESGLGELLDELQVEKIVHRTRIRLEIQRLIKEDADADADAAFDYNFSYNAGSGSGGSGSGGSTRSGTSAAIPMVAEVSVGGRAEVSGGSDPKNGKTRGGSGARAGVVRADASRRAAQAESYNGLDTKQQQDLFKQGMVLHQQGQLQHAQQLYEEALEVIKGAANEDDDEDDDDTWQEATRRLGLDANGAVTAANWLIHYRMANVLHQVGYRVYSV
jgi:hypothetical protein